MAFLCCKRYALFGTFFIIMIIGAAIKTFIWAIVSIVLYAKTI